MSESNELKWEAEEMELEMQCLREQALELIEVSIMKCRARIICIRSDDDLHKEFAKEIEAKVEKEKERKVAKEKSKISKMETDVAAAMRMEEVADCFALMGYEGKTLRVKRLPGLIRTAMSQLSSMDLEKDKGRHKGYWIDVQVRDEIKKKWCEIAAPMTKLSEIAETVRWMCINEVMTQLHHKYPHLCTTAIKTSEEVQAHIIDLFTGNGTTPPSSEDPPRS